MLDVERRFYADNLPSLLARYDGRFVVVKDMSVIGAFSTAEEAMREGARRFGLQPFLLRLVTQDSPEEVSIPALALGLLHADPPHTIQRTGNRSAGPNSSD